MYCDIAVTILLMWHTNSLIREIINVLNRAKQVKAGWKIIMTGNDKKIGK